MLVKAISKMKIKNYSYFTLSGIFGEVLSIEGQRCAFRRKAITEYICEQYRLYRGDLLRDRSRESDPD